LFQHCILTEFSHSAKQRELAKNDKKLHCVAAELPSEGLICATWSTDIRSASTVYNHPLYPLRSPIHSRVKNLSYCRGSQTIVQVGLCRDPVPDHSLQDFHSVISVGYCQVYVSLAQNPYHAKAHLSTILAENPVTRIQRQFSASNLKASIREKGTTSNGYLNGVACVNKYKRRDSLNNMQFCMQPIQGGGLLVRAKIKLKQNKFLDRKKSGAHISHIANHGFLRSSFCVELWSLHLL
jgi:hypothetical protein